jgi:FkbM family methyltransferase
MSSEEATNHGEGDVDLLVEQRFFRNQNSGVFVEVGAAGPEFLSLSAMYRKMGWTVFSIEPNPVFCELHRERGFDILEYACGDHDEDGVDFSVVNSHGARWEEGEVSYESLSSLEVKESYKALSSAGDIRKIKVNLRRLDTILKTHAKNIGHIDLLSVDVEGWELEVLNGLDFHMYRPRVLVIENIFRDKKYRAYMRTKGYKLWRCIWPNDIYATDGVSFWDPHAYSFSLWTTHQWKRFLRIPARLRRIFGSTVGDN